MKHWNEIDATLNRLIDVKIYCSTRTNLRVVIGNVPGPMVYGCISFATEADSDDGLPHTLEHLVFMGSKKYPFKGILDIIANQCLANGTNAWTERDHTAFTLTTVGSNGFFKVLPIYIEHLLNPMLTESQFTTEVHHIDGEGNDAGVVYSEMQGAESDMQEIIVRKAKQMIYPCGHPYAVDTGGRLKNLRESCTIEKVRAYHKKYYHLSNMVVTVCGKVDHSKLLQIMEDVEQEHMASVPEVFPRPFSIQPCEIKESIVEVIRYPSDDITNGAVELTWLAHDSSDLHHETAFNVLSDYFTKTAVSVFKKDFVFLESPLASSVLMCTVNSVPCEVSLQFCGVPVSKVDEILSKIKNETIPNHLEASTWDMERMGFLIDQNILELKNKLETSPQNIIMEKVIRNQISDNDEELLKMRLLEIDYLRSLKSQPAAFWIELLRKYLLKPSVCVVAIPDGELVTKVAEEERKRIINQRERLGESGLLKKKNELDEAIKENASQHPTHELLDKLMVKDLEDFDRFPVQSLTKDSAGLTSIQAKFLSQFPFDATLHNCPTKFVEAIFLLDSGDLSLEQRCLLLLFTDLLFQSPAVIDGIQQSAEDVAKLSTKHLIDHSVNVGVSNQYNRFVSLTLKVETENFENLSKWVQIFLQGVIIDGSRVNMVAQRQASMAKNKKRDGSAVAQFALKYLNFEKNSNSSLYNCMLLEHCYENIAKEAVENPKIVIQKLEDLRQALFTKGLNVHIVCDVDLIDEKLMTLDLWQWYQKDFRFGIGEKFSCSPGEDNKSTTGSGYLIGIGGSETSFIIQSTTIDSDFNSEDIAPIMILAQYMSQFEGPLWNAVRGDGLAYSIKINVFPDDKRIFLVLYRCAQPIMAYERTKYTVMNLINSGALKQSGFEGAKRSLIYKLLEKEENIVEAGRNSILNSLRKVPPNFTKTLCENIWNTSVEEVLRIGGPKVLKLFEKYNYVITAHPLKVPEMVKAFPNIRAIDFSEIQYV
ncbi:unnamed protein product [Caenorhabditis bovis]|uniref:Uncharacterized protein n=1 Tax=Caenorhabditis bovis TaxID=2654633 RepID=A0A8S1EER2_9PELO|nr:unnamed protein product [Caenorhabditis bovis]